MDPSQSTLQQSPYADEGSPDTPRTPGLMLVFLSGAPSARPMPLSGGQLELGRGDGSPGAVRDLRMSRRHARVRLDGQRFWVGDLGSQNGTSVDGENVPSGSEREVQRVMRAGDSLFVPTRDVGPLERRGVKHIDDFVRGPAFQSLLDQVVQAARLGFTLHIHGETGTGKEGVARAFHQAGQRSSGPFVAVNCAAIPQSIAERLLFGAKRGAYSGADADAQGHFQSADGGTLFLDEVEELDLAVQAKLLRALETREVQPLGASRPRHVDVQICSATNKDLRSLVASGRLREDLYFRIGRPEVSVPALRQRPEEIPFLLQRELALVAPLLTLHVSLVEACLMRPWPGNVRELLVETRSAVQAALMQGAQRVEGRHLAPKAGALFGSAGRTPEARPPSSRSAPEPRPVKQLDPEMRDRILETLRQHQGNVTAAARALGLHRTQLRRLLERHQIAAAPEEKDDPDT